jgi:hypothetical protein
VVAITSLSNPTLFSVRHANIEDDAQPPVGWQLQTGEDGSPVSLGVNLILPPLTRCVQVKIANVMIEGAEWKFS